MSDDLVKRLRANHLDECYEAIDRIEALTAERDALKAGQIDAIRAALEAAADACVVEADKCDDAIKWSRSARYKQDCKAASYAMRDRASAIRAIAPAAIAAKLKGDGDERA